MSAPKLLLDLFCGEGGAGVGYHRAGWDVFGVDLGGKKADDTPTLGPLRRYPFEYHRGDALEFLVRHGSEFDAIHASPPCQGYSIATAGNPAARAKRTLLCGRMFGLGAIDADGMPLVLDRHRLFESNVPLVAPAHPRHGAEQVAGVYGGGRHAKRRDGESLAEVAPRDRYAARVERGGGYTPRSIPVQQALLGIDWMTVKGMQESIPPVFAEHVGAQLLAAVQMEAVA